LALRRTSLGKPEYGLDMRPHFSGINEIADLRVL